MATHLGRPAPVELGEDFPPSDQEPQFQFSLQLTPEMAETLSACQYVCFVDAHTGEYHQDLNVATLQPDFQISPFTHHMTPQTCLILAQSLYGRAPEALMVSVHGYRFGFTHELSAETARLSSQAVETILTWLKDKM